MWIVGLYIAIASVTPVWILLQPRDYLSSFLLYAMLAIAAIGGIIKLSVNYVLVGIESINVVGAAIGTLCCFAVVALLDLFVIHRIIPSPPRISRIFVKPVAASAVMAAAAWAANGLLAKLLGMLAPFRAVDASGAVTGLSRMGIVLSTLGGIGVGGIVYLILVVTLRVISKDDLALMPHGDKLSRLLRVR